MKEILELGHKIGTEPNDIKSIYTHVSKENEYDEIYVVYNNGAIKKIAKPSKQTQEEFIPEFKKFLLSVGANDKNRDQVWFLVHDYEEEEKKDLDNIKLEYQRQQNRLSDNIKKRYRAKKVKVMEKVLKNDETWDHGKTLLANAVSTGIFVLANLSAHLHQNNLVEKITALAIISGVILSSISAYKLKNIIKKEFEKQSGNASIDQQLLTGLPQHEQFLIEQENFLIENKHTKR